MVLNKEQVIRLESIRKQLDMLWAELDRYKENMANAKRVIKQFHDQRKSFTTRPEKPYWRRECE